MKKKLFLPSTRLSFFMAAILFTTACSTVTVKERTPLPEVPEYVRVPHPAGYDIADLKAALLSPLAPKGVLGEFADTCDDEYRKLLATTASKEDRKKGAEELVTRDPERIHWCFYSKISRLNDVLSSDETFSLRQKKVIDTYEFLSPVANAYVSVYQDTRYLRWASVYYTKISEWVFFRKTVPKPENSLMFVENQRSDLEPWVPVKGTGEVKNSVFEKYGIDLAPAPKTVNPMEDASVTKNAPATRKPASVAPAPQ